MSAEHTIGFGNSSRASSRVLKPPGGGHTDFFSPAEEIKPHARPKYDQQNSSNLNFCMNTKDPNEKVLAVVEPEHGNEAIDASAPASNGSAAETVAPAHESHEAGDAAAPQNLPKYHHHRSTALW